MAWLALLRHGVTEWNQLGLIQGRIDVALNAAGVARLQTIRAHADFLDADWLTSPLQRAVQTATLLNPQKKPTIAPPLIETDWGEFEGLRSRDIAGRIRELKLKPDYGLDFTPPGGESAREVRARLTAWAATLGDTNRGCVAVTHKGVIRCALSAACDWDMADEFDIEPDWALPHIFQISDGEMRLLRLNHPWSESPTGPNELKSI